MTQWIEPQFNVEGGRLVMFHQEQTGLPQTKDANVNDRDRMQDLLTQEKYLTDAYNVAMFEASHDSLSNTIKQNFDQCHQLQRQVYNTMFQKGWYKLPVADAESVAYTFNQFQQYQAQMPFPPGQQGIAQTQIQTQQTQTQQTQTQQEAITNPADRLMQQAVERALQDVAEHQHLPANTLTNRRTH